MNESYEQELQQEKLTGQSRTGMSFPAFFVKNSTCGKL